MDTPASEQSTEPKPDHLQVNGNCSGAGGIRLSVISPVLNECPWIGYSILAALPYVHEFIYALDEQSNDGTRELLRYVKDRYAHEKLIILDHPTFHPSDRLAYNRSFNRCIEQMTGNAAFFLHADMIITSFPSGGIPEGPLAWWTSLTSYAGDLETVITKGRCVQWKNIHAKRFGLHYYGGYGSTNEDFYHSEITGKSYRHFGTEFSRYPFKVADSGIEINHYCEVKDYDRRFEKMKTCLKELYPNFSQDRISEMAAQHPRVTLKAAGTQFGEFEFSKTSGSIPPVFGMYEEFERFKKEKVMT